MIPVDTFLENASRILETASAGEAEVAILVDSDGALRVVCGSDWPLHSLAAHHGARQSYQVSRRGSTVRVEGREGSRRCVIESSNPARWLLGRTTPRPLRAGTAPTLPAASD
jgi:hypothetical protein